MWRDVGALGHEAHVTQITVVHDLPIMTLVDRLELHLRGFIDQIKQGGKGVAQREATTTAVTDIKHALELGKQCALVVELGTVPVERMPLGGLKTPLTPLLVIAGR
jgi:hypothetical protein